MASCIPEKKTERPLNPVLIARLDEQNVGRRQRKCSGMQVWATQFNGENRKKTKTKQNKPGTIQNKIIWSCKCRAAVNRKFC